MTTHRRSNMSVDNLARAQRTMLSTAEPGTPARIERTSQGEPIPQGTQGQQPIKPHGVHLNPAVRLSKGWGPPLTGQIVASELTSHRTRDSTRVPALLEQNDNPVASIHADGAYDRKSVYEAARRKGNGHAVRMLIPAARDARLRAAPSRALKERNRNVRLIRTLGRRQWHKQSGYSQRSMVENTIYRYKTILGGNMRSRGMEGQRIEVQLGCKILNQMALFGMPDSYTLA